MNSKWISSVGYFDILSQINADQLNLIDLRSPCEFKTGSMPGSHNIALFNDQERILIGTAYRQEGSQNAVSYGVEIFSSKCQGFIEEILAKINPSGEIAIHCARGGMRSGFVARLLAAMGLRVFLLDGGYKLYRHQVLLRMLDLARHNKLVLIGQTGSGKTELLHRLKRCPFIDFEELARHRGSALGGLHQEKPPATQQNFENSIATQYELIRNEKCILVEHERSLGPVILPQDLRKSLNNSRMILLERDFDNRVERLTSLYFADFNEQEFEKFKLSLQMFRDQISQKTKDQLIKLAELKRFREITEILLIERYDKVYAKSLKNFAPNTIATFNLSNDFDGSLQAIEAMLKN